MDTRLPALLLATVAPLLGFILTNVIFILEDTTPNPCLVETCYCENHTALTSAFAQPANTFSAYAFILFAWILSLHAAYNHRASPRSRMRANLFFPLLYTVLLTCIGTSSVAFHIWLSDTTGTLDGASIHLYACLALSLTLTRRINSYRIRRGFRPIRDRWTILLFLALSLVELLIVCLAPSLVQQIMFGLLLGFVLLLEIPLFESIYTRPKRWQWLVFGFICLFIAFFMWYFSRGEGDSLCQPESPIQGHAAWHVLSALASMSAYFYVDSEPSQKEAREHADKLRSTLLTNQKKSG